MEDQSPEQTNKRASTAETDDYIFGRGDCQASARLNLQHLYHKLHTEYLLHPDISTGTEDIRVAEIGTGTGVWLLDFARTAPPSARLDGFDISAEQFPCKELLPSNISFQKLDAFAPVPEHLIGVYDVVHIRLFNTIVRGDDASPLISNMIKMLKPGGYLQWDENAPIEQEVRVFAPGASKAALEELLSFMQKTQDSLGKTNWVGRLHHTMQQLGLVATRLDRFTTRPEFGRLHDDIMFWTCEDFSINTLDRRAGTEGRERGAKLRRLVSKAYEDSVWWRVVLRWDFKLEKAAYGELDTL